MNKFLLGAIIGGAIGYMGHRAIMRSADSFLKAQTNVPKED